MNLSILNLKRFIKPLALLAAMLLAAPVHSGSGPAEPLLAKEIISTLSSAEDTVDRMYFSGEITTSHPKVSQGVDLLELERKALRSFIATGPAPGKEIILVRYGVTDGQIFDLLIDAMKKNIPVTFVTDANRALEHEFGPTENIFTDFSKATFKDSDMGPGLKRLIESGFKWNTGPFKVLSQPLFQKTADKMIPIMHEKALLLKNGKKSKLLRGTANLSSASRINRMFEHTDPLFNKIYEDHYRQLIEVFSKGGKIRDIPPTAPTRMIFKDSTSLEVAFTDGKYNPNDRLSSIIKRAINDPENIKIEELVLSQFAFTNKDFSTTLNQYFHVLKLKGMPYPKVILFVDAKFSLLDGYGQAPVLAGYDTIPEWGNVSRGLDSEFLGSFKIYMYQRPAIDPATGTIVPEKVRNGEPSSRYLLHDKSASIRVSEYGEAHGYFASGSENLSGHFDNAEEQVLYYLRGDSWLMSEYQNSVVDFIKRNPEHAVAFDIGIIRQIAADLTGHTENEIPTNIAKRIRRSLYKGDVDGITRALLDASILSSDLATRPTANEIKQTVSRIGGFMRWYYQYDVEAIATPGAALQRLRKFAAIIPEIGKFEKNGWSFVQQLNRLTSKAELSGDNLGRFQQKQINDVWKSMKLPGKAPPVANIVSATYNKGRSNLYPANIVADFDDNFLFLPTKITLFKKAGAGDELKPSIRMSTADYSILREKVGKGGIFVDSEKDSVDLKNYEERNLDDQHSFERFGSAKDGPGNRNYLLEDVKSMVEDGTFDSHKGPAWILVESATRSRDGAKKVSIVTARSQDPQELYEVTQYLVSVGKLRNPLSIENLHCVGGAENPSAAKAEIFKKMLFDLQDKKISDKWDLITPPDGSENKARFHVWTFSDDDWGNYSKAKEVIQAEMKKGNFGNTKVILFFTGMNHAEHLAEARVITPTGGERLLFEGEEQDIAKVLKIENRSCDELLTYPHQALPKSLAPSILGA